ncbi:hypothetical protein LCGC14_0964830 [marine sediment metagenome]|uniref:Uncharacterized protein n=1 Tax=marine sediment metagenome TaxID=412755 RepID=A0A0F9RJZ7_9ZZZZ
MSKWKSRKFWLAIIATIYTVVATLGYNVPVDQVLVADAMVAVWIFAEALVDAFRK